MKKLWIVVFMFFFLFTLGCSKDDSGEILIRVRNISNYSFTNVQVSSGTSEIISFGTIEANNYSDYKAFSEAFSYGYVEVKIEDSTYVLQPTDYVGETKLPNGKYTYELGITSLDSKYGSLLLNFVED